MSEKELRREIKRLSDAKRAVKGKKKKEFDAEIAKLSTMLGEALGKFVHRDGQFIFPEERRYCLSKQ